MPGAGKKKYINILHSALYLMIDNSSCIPGVSLDFSIAGRSPKLNWGDGSSFIFSGEYVPGAVKENQFCIYCICYIADA